MERRPVFRGLHQMGGSFTEEHRASLEMDSLVFVPHKQRPHGVRLVNLDRAVRVVQAGMVHNGIHHHIMHLFAVLMSFLHRWPQHVVFVHVIPKHFVNSNLVDALKVSIDRFGQDTIDTELVDIEACSMPIVKDLGMTESVWRRTAR
jgi:hypothetical protein